MISALQRPLRTALAPIVVALLVVLAAASACEGSKAPPVQAQAPAAREEVDHWVRAKDCAAQADRLAKRGGWDDRSDRKFHAMGWENHYNAHLAKCFVVVTWWNSGAGKDSPVTYDELYDGFEGRLLAMCNGALVKHASAFCHVEDRDARSMGDCGACRGFMSQRLER